MTTSQDLHKRWREWWDTVLRVNVPWQPILTKKKTKQKKKPTEPSFHRTFSLKCNRVMGLKSTPLFYFLNMLLVIQLGWQLSFADLDVSHTLLSVHSSLLGEGLDGAVGFSRGKTDTDTLDEKARKLFFSDLSSKRSKLFPRLCSPITIHHIYSADTSALTSIN